ncbi:MAG: LTA synthase family protein, partial [Prevotella sp.]|nr:LTA synthase family protein [Prevotella sp.]
MLSKVPFLLMYSSQIGDAGIGDYLSVIWHGLRLDIAIAGYLTLLPGLLLMVSLWYRGKVLRYLWHGYFAVTTLLYSLAIVSNLGLYGYWGFPLDNTPLLYVKTSPADALASMTTWQLIMAPLAIILLAAVIFYVFYRMSRSLFHTRRPLTCFSL